MMKALVAIMLASLITGIVMAGSVDSDLAAKVNSSTNHELIPVMVILKEQANPDEAEAMSQGLDKHAAREMVILYLKNLAQTSQRNVLHYLTDQTLDGQAADVQPLFIANVIGLKATPAVIRTLAQFPEVDIVSYDPERYMLDDVGSGPVAPGLDPGMDEGDEIAWGVADVHAPEVWALGYNGTGVLVGMIDTGVNYNHLDLTDHMWDGGIQYPNHGYDFYNNDNNPMDDATSGHGTHTAGSVASDGTAGSQCGVAPNATIMAIKVLGASGSGPSSAVLAGLNFSVDQGCDVFNMSLGITGGGSTSDKATYRTACNNALAAGVIASISAGNSGQQQGTYPIPNNVGTPGNVPPPWPSPYQTLTGGQSCVVGVGSTTSSHSISSSSSRGPVTWANVSPWNDYAYNPGMGLLKPDVSAPGSNIKSCSRTNISGYTTMSGTSMAAPHVTGAIALILSKNPAMTPRQLDSLLETTALDLGTTGKDNTFGAGLINALNAVNATPGGTPPSPDVTVTPLSPPIVIPAGGGSFQFNASVVNNGAPGSFAVWTKIKNPDGTFTAPQLGPITLIPAVGVTITRLRIQNVPGTWATGLYTYIAYAALTYPSTAIIDSSYFTFTKSAVGNGGPFVNNSQCYGEPFPGEQPMAAFLPSGLDLAVSPNPFNPATAISFELQASSFVSLKVYDTAGRLVVTLVNGWREAGDHQITFDGSGLPSGLYFAKLIGENFNQVQKLVLMK